MAKIDLTSCNPSPGAEPPTPPTGCVGVPTGEITDCPTTIDMGVPFLVKLAMSTPNIGSTITGGQLVAVDANGDPVSAQAFGGVADELMMTINTPGIHSIELIVRDNCGGGTQSQTITKSIEVVGPTYGDSGASASSNRVRQAAIQHEDI